MLLIKLNLQLFHYNKFHKFILLNDFLTQEKDFPS